MDRIDVLDAAAIRNGLARQGEGFEVEVLERCGSTNSLLLAREPAALPVLLLADEQTEGRGRRGRRWHAAPGSALMFSLRWEFSAEAASLAGLSLAAGVSIAQTLQSLGAHDVALKWPNDLLASLGQDGAKLGGILIETRIGAGRVAAIIGVGLNYRRSPLLGERLKRRVASLEEAIDPLPGRNVIAIGVATGLAKALRVFGARGFEPFQADWQALHASQGKAMRIRTAHGKVLAGIADGVGADGGLLLRTRHGVQRIHSGTVVRERDPAGSAA